MHRAVRFIRHNAQKYKINPDKLGVTGGSAGGHLSLTLGTQGKKGNPNAPDPVDRESSEVQAVACFYPPTDFANWSKEGDDAVGFGTTLKFQGAFGPQSFTPEGRALLSQQTSPIHYVTSNMAPTLVMHGDADAMVPIYQAKKFEQRCAEAKATYKLIIKPGADHGWAGMDADLKVFADWFDQYLRDIKTAGSEK
jgi:acetyl esterase/lipase